jgi:hypothetical protein
LIQWALEGKTDGEGYGFPFDRPHVEFAKRLRLLGQRLEQIKDIHLRGQWADNKPLFKLSCELKKLSADEGLERMLTTIDHKIQVFDQLRKAMRIAETGGAAGLNSGTDPIPLGPIQKAVEKFRQQITSRSDYATTGSWKAMIDQIDKYKDKLFADPITVKTPRGPLVIQPQRTNNIMERLFRDFRRGVRRRTGHNSISRFCKQTSGFWRIVAIVVAIRVPREKHICSNVTGLDFPRMATSSQRGRPWCCFELRIATGSV